VWREELDKELERRGRKAVYHADGCNIYVHSNSAGERQAAGRAMQLVALARATSRPKAGNVENGASHNGQCRRYPIVSGTPNIALCTIMVVSRRRVS
jgi:hypothetical protein